jgi:hypothetical protein
MGSDNEYEHQNEWKKIERGYDRLEMDMEAVYGVGVMDLSLMWDGFWSAGKLGGLADKIDGDGKSE